MVLISSLFGAAGDFASAAGHVAEGAAYKKAQHYAEQNAVISQEAGDIKLEQTSRQIFRVLGSQQANYAGAGLTSGGSAQAVIRNSVSQGSLEKAIVNEQTAINVTGYKSQAAQFSGMSFAANAAAVADAAKGVGSILSAFGL